MVSIFDFVFTLFSMLQDSFDTLIDFLFMPFSDVMENLPAFIQWVIPEWLGTFTIMEIAFGAGLFVFLIKVIINFVVD